MSDNKDKTIVMPDHYDVTVATFKRFERRTNIKLFSALADAIREAGEAIDGVALAKAVFTDSESLAAFIYECGFDEERRKAMPFEEWLECVSVGELFGEYDKAVTALFTFSPSQKTTTQETGNKKDENAA